MKQKIKTRDPQPTNRDPAVVPSMPNIPPPPAKRAPLKCVPELQTKCPECGFTSSRIDAVRVDTIRGFVLKYRTCHACHTRFASRADVSTDAPKFPLVEGVDG